jgi:hypothetical protein
MNFCCCCSGIDTGAVLIDGRNAGVTLDGMSFSSNSLSNSVSFPSLRHNVFVSGGAIVNVLSMTVDTEESKFVYVSDDGYRSVVNGLEVC